jgi:citrate synthase
MGYVKDTFKQKSDAANAEIKDLLKEHGKKKLARSPYHRSTRE